MSIYNSSYCGCIWHHGIKGQKWGVRRTSEELGHISSSAGKVAKSEKTATIVDGVYRSTKGFTAAVAKLAKYCLNPEKRHSKELFDVGYKESDADLLFKHLEEGYDYSKRGNSEKTPYGEKFDMPMLLGVTTKKLFNTGWQIDNGATEPKFLTAYIDRRLKEGK